MKWLIAFLSVAVALVVGLCFGLVAADKNNKSYIASSEAANIQGNQITTKTTTEVQNNEKKQAEPKTRSEKVEKQEIKKEEKTKTNTNNTKKSEEKEYDVYYHVADVLYRDGQEFLVLDMIYMYYDSNHDNDYYIVNNNTKLRTYRVSRNAKFKIWIYEPMKLINVDYYRFLEKINEHSIIDVKLSGDTIVSATEVYVP